MEAPTLELVMYQVSTEVTFVQNLVVVGLMTSCDSGELVMT